MGRGRGSGICSLHSFPLPFSLCQVPVWQWLCSPHPSPPLLLGAFFHSLSSGQILAATPSPCPFTLRGGDSFLLFLAPVSSPPTLNPHLCKQSFLLASSISLLILLPDSFPISSSTLTDATCTQSTQSIQFTEPLEYKALYKVLWEIQRFSLALEEGAYKKTYK